MVVSRSSQIGRNLRRRCMATVCSTSRQRNQQLRNPVIPVRGDGFDRNVSLGRGLSDDEKVFTKTRMNLRGFSNAASVSDIDVCDGAISNSKNGFGGSFLYQESNPDNLFKSLGMKKSDLFELAAKPLTPVMISDMYKYATAVDKRQRLLNAQFLHRELPIRLAQRAADLLILPNGLSEAKHIRQVACAYISKLHHLQSFPLPQTVEQEKQFTDELLRLVHDRSYIPRAISQGLADWCLEHRDQQVDRLQEMEDALYRFFTAHVGLRLLIEHHILSGRRDSAKELKKVIQMFPDTNDNNMGCIDPNVDLVKEITRVADRVTAQTKDFYGFAPKIEIFDCIEKANAGNFTYIPNHLHHMMGELLKNSCRATVRNFLKNQKGITHDKPVGLGSLSLFNSNQKVQDIPAIRVVVVKGDEDVTIKVEDKGGGIPRSRMSNIWKFAHSTADEEESSSDFGMDSLSGTKIKGFGLPICRIYARYVGGELTLKSMEGHGLDAYLHLPRLGDAGENLPGLVRRSPVGTDSTPRRRVRNYSTMSMTASRITGNTRMNEINEQSAGSQSSNPPESLVENLRQSLTQTANSHQNAFAFFSRR